MTNMAKLGALAILLLSFGPPLAAQPVAIPSRSRGSAVTFSNQIVRIFQKNCQVCHHPGAIAPSSLMSYSEALPYARSIKTETQSRRMPPWKPVAGFGEFRDERHLSDREIEVIARWVDLGAPEGDPRDLPPPAQFPDEWTLGTPDLVLQPDADFSIAADASDIYRCFSLPMGLLQNRNITGVEVRPGNSSVVHHMVLFQDPLALSTRLAVRGDPQPGYSCFGGPGIPVLDIIGAWAPGNQPQTFPEGVGLRVTAGSRAVMQVHYHPNGAAQTDRTRVGLYFDRQPVQKDLQFAFVINEDFVIPAGASRHTVTASAVIPPLRNARAISILPHMHLLGREIRLDAVYPDGARHPMIYINDWDFQWQGTYYYKEPVPLPPGTRLELTAVYDNSADNPKNPNSPPRNVRFGEQTTDEMCLALLWFITD